MPAKCPFCETNTHGDSDKEQYPVCERNFLTPSEAWAITAEDKKPDETTHVFANPSNGMLIGADWSRKAIKDLFERCKYIERCDPTGKARAMKHGLAVRDFDDRNLFVETDETKLKAYEDLFLNA